MFVRSIVIFSMIFMLTACASKDDKGAMGEDQMTYEQMTPGPLDGTEPVYGEQMAGPQPGSQADLVVNVGDRVFFGYDRYDLNDEARQILDMQAQWLQQYPHVTVTIEGHTDERGTREYNLALGERRATSVKNYLIALGVDPRRITTISFGKERPAVMESSPSGWAQNRRGVTKVD
ncbi:MAG: peptidoglycan-associated lipoprotein Pal [Alphaproteobacteria bacterium]|nr:peptidoglycan-associated lipoprotein Pal [Alphaproteobacteria bacterium]